MIGITHDSEEENERQILFRRSIYETVHLLLYHIIHLMEFSFPLLINTRTRVHKSLKIFQVMPASAHSSVDAEYQS